MSNSTKMRPTTLDARFVENENGDLVQTFERDNLSSSLKDYISHEKQAEKEKNKLMQGEF